MKKILFILLFPLFANAQTKPFTILFESNKAEIYHATTLNLIEAINKVHPDSVIIEGYCDSIGDVKYNKKLSEKRANAVKKILVEHGLDKKNIRECVGYGKSNPLNNNSTEEERQKNRRVVVYFNGEGFHPSEIENTKVVTPIHEPKTEKKIVDQAIKKGGKLTLPPIKFYGATHQVMQESEPVLKDLLTIMRKHPTLKIDIQGHVCCTYGNIFDGDDIETGTHDLSIRRAKAIYEFLADNGIDKSRLSIKGYGGAVKIYPEERNDFEKQANRRVEFIVVEE